MRGGTGSRAEPKQRPALRVGSKRQRALVFIDETMKVSETVENLLY